MIDKSLKILLIEDDLVITHDINLLLKREGFEKVVFANNAIKAIDKLAAKDIDFVIIDINLGSCQNGIDIAEIIKNKYKIPFIFMTSYSDKVTLQKALEQRPNGYIVKPVQEDTLITTIYLAIKNHQKSVPKIDFNSLEMDLTKKELDILKHICSGISYNEIAGLENVSINTIRFHVKNIYLKFNVNSSTELLSLIINMS